MKANYDAKSFWAGVAAGQQLRGWAAYGVMEGWNPDGDLILRPITQGIGRISFGTAVFHGIRPFEDIMGVTSPVQDLPVITEDCVRIMFGSSTFNLRAVNESLKIDGVTEGEV